MNRLNLALAATLLVAFQLSSAMDGSSAKQPADYIPNTSLLPSAIIDLGIDYQFDIDDERTGSYLFLSRPKTFGDLIHLVYRGKKTLTPEQRALEFERFKRGKETFKNEQDALKEVVSEYAECSHPIKVMEGTPITFIRMHKLGAYIKKKYIEPKDGQIEVHWRNILEKGRKIRSLERSNGRLKIGAFLLSLGGFAGGLWASPYILPYLRTTVAPALRMIK